MPNSLGRGTSQFFIALRTRTTQFAGHWFRLLIMSIRIRMWQKLIPDGKSVPFILGPAPGMDRGRVGNSEHSPRHWPGRHCALDGLRCCPSLSERKGKNPGWRPRDSPDMFPAYFLRIPSEMDLVHNLKRKETVISICNYSCDLAPSCKPKREIYIYT